MEDEIRALVQGLKTAGPAPEDALAEAKLALGDFPEDYLEFMRFSNGGEGTIGESYLVLWPAEELVSRNDGYGVDEFAPGLVLFGTDGGGEGFAFDLRSSLFHDIKIVCVPLAGMNLEDVKILADSFLGFLRSMASGEWMR